MKTKFKSNLIRYILLIYGLFYFWSFIVPLIFNDSGALESPMSKLELVSIPLVFTIFLIGTIYSWFNEKIAGIILCCWHFVNWLMLMLFWPDAGMVLVLVFPILILAAFLIRDGYIKSNDLYKVKSYQQKLTLRVLVINYMAIYALIVFANIVPKWIGWDLPTRVDDLSVWNYTSFPGILLLFEFFFFILGFVILWKSELIAGFIFIVWYLIIVFLTLQYPKFANSGPYVLIGLTILVQGILYITSYFKQSQSNEG